MWTTRGGEGAWWAGVWGDPEAIENIDAFLAVKKQWDENYPLFVPKCASFAKKLIKVLDKLQDNQPVYPGTDESNKPKSDLDELLSMIPKNTDETEKKPAPVQGAPIDLGQSPKYDRFVRDSEGRVVSAVYQSGLSDTTILSNNPKTPDTIKKRTFSKPPPVPKKDTKPNN
jgi:hypothetical protein